MRDMRRSLVAPPGVLAAALVFAGCGHGDPSPGPPLPANEPVAVARAFAEASMTCTRAAQDRAFSLLNRPGTGRETLVSAWVRGCAQDLPPGERTYALLQRTVNGDAATVKVRISFRARVGLTMTVRLTLVNGRWLVDPGQPAAG